jgi:hypothetical protein
MPQAGGPYRITRSAIAGGGGHSNGDTLDLTGTVAQAASGPDLAGDSFALAGGFWTSRSSVSVSGRVLNPQGRGVRNALIRLTDQQNSTVEIRTGPYGAYQFDGLPPGRTYTLAATSRRFAFTSRTFNIDEPLTGVDLTATQ